MNLDLTPEGAPEPKPPRRVHLFTIPADTEPGRCGACRKPVYFVRQAKSGKLMPVDADVEGGLVPIHGDITNDGHDGRGLSHFATCTNPTRYRRPR